MAFGKKDESTPVHETGSTETAVDHGRPTTTGTGTTGTGTTGTTGTGTTGTGTTGDRYGRDTGTTGYTDVDRDGRDDRVERAERAEHDDRTARAYRADDTDHAHDKFGGMNLGAGFFGWLVAVAMTILLIGIVGAILTAVGSSTSITQSEARDQAGSIGVATAIVLLVILALAYYFGGYVAGRMSRFDGARQGALVWIIGLLVTIAAAVLGWVFGDKYNVLDRVNLPRLPISTDEAGTGAVIAVVAVLVVTLVAAVLGGKIGNHYHTRVDKAARL
jgi:hypothetical protein